MAVILLAGNDFLSGCSFIMILFFLGLASGLIPKIIFASKIVTQSMTRNGGGARRYLPSAPLGTIPNIVSVPGGFQFLVWSVPTGATDVFYYGPVVDSQNSLI
ncbi:hypothetical protein J3F83DRAFT_723038 [Trichoderma novae-zelandiae]